LKRKNKQGLNEHQLTSLKYLDAYRGGSKGGQVGPDPPLARHFNLFFYYWIIKCGEGFLF